MNKKYLLGGFLFWAAVSGYMGMRILDSYTEDAVAAALASIPAQAKEIRFSFLNRSLEIDDLEYEIPDRSVQRKGRIDHVSIKDFNRKILFVMPSTPAYSPEALPRVAGSVTMTGLSETRHEEFSKATTSLASLEIKGWRQRLGLVFDRYARSGTGKSFFEELYRCHVDGLQADDLHVAVENAQKNGEIQFQVRQIRLSDGIRAPLAEEFCPRISIQASDVSLTGEGLSLSLEHGRLIDFRPPSPETAATFCEGKIRTDGGLLQKLLLQDMLDTRIPAFSLLEMNGCSVNDQNNGTRASFSHFSCASKLSEARCELNLALQSLRAHVPLQKEFGDIVTRFAPDGLLLDVLLKGTIAEKEFSVSASSAVKGLCSIDSSFMVRGNLFTPLNKALDEGRYADLLKLFSGAKLEKARLDYADAGMSALALSMAAKKAGLSPQELLERLGYEAGRFSSSDSGLIPQIGRALQEQLSYPGEISVELEPSSHPSLSQLTLMALVQPSKLPFVVTSKAGVRSMKEYLQ